MKTVYRISGGYSPFISENESGLLYCFPVSSGHVDIYLEFNISEKDLEVLRANIFRFKVLYFILFHEVQLTFGTGNPNPRKYTIQEFEIIKKKVLYHPENEVRLYLNRYAKNRNKGEYYFESFSKNVFENDSSSN